MPSIMVGYDILAKAMATKGVVGRQPDGGDIVTATGLNTASQLRNRISSPGADSRPTEAAKLDNKKPPPKPQQNPAVEHEVKTLPLKDLFVPKFKLLRILFEVDPIAGWIVFGSVITNGLSKTWGIAVQSDSTTAFQEAILAKNFDIAIILPFLIRRIAVEIMQQITVVVGLYGHKRYKKKMQRHLSQLLIESQSHLSYPVRADSDILRRYNNVNLDWQC
jgi:hypothetical protein